MVELVMVVYKFINNNNLNRMIVIEIEHLSYYFLTIIIFTLFG